MTANKVRAIAFYLPQFYPTSENDKWWEPGFTEWTNVVRAKPLFKGHYQPRLPRDLGFYDLRVQETREYQAVLAQEAGIEGFCYWHYWFGDGKRLLDRVFQEVVASGKPRFPFCLCWANHSWYSKTWDPNMPDKLLIEQRYLGEKDYIAHFNAMLPAFKDNRYMKVNGKLLFGIFESHMIPDFTLFKNTWNRLALENALPGFHFFAYVQGDTRLPLVLNTMDYDSIVFDCVYDSFRKSCSSLKGRIFHNTFYKFLHRPHLINYDDYSKLCLSKFKAYGSFVPCINPDFDHSPRSSYKGYIFDGSTPEKWGKLLSGTIKLLQNKPSEERIVFIKAWNEWGEGNYLEPDQKWGKQYIMETKNQIIC